MSLAVRPVEPADITAIQAIYAHHVLNGSGTFEEAPPSVEDMQQRLADIRSRGLPWVVALLDGAVAGYAYAGPFRLRSAYRFTAETSVYISADQMGRGIGRALLSRVIADCQVAGVRQILAMIGDSSNVGSIALHRALGFERVGIFKDVGYKSGRWLDVVAMQRTLT